MNFQRNGGHGPEPAHDHGPERDIGDEMPVHDINVNPVGACRDRLGHLVGQMGHVGRQDRWGELDAVGKVLMKSKLRLATTVALREKIASALGSTSIRLALLIEYHDTRATSKVRSSSGGWPPVN